MEIEVYRAWNNSLLTMHIQKELLHIHIIGNCLLLNQACLAQSLKQEVLPNREFIYNVNSHVEVGNLFSNLPQHRV